MAKPSRGEVWQAELDPTRGHEQAGRRPVLIVSVDPLNHGPADVVIIAPITSRQRGIPSHVPMTPPDGGLRRQSFILCEAVRSISKSRLSRRIGVAGRSAMAAVEDTLRMLLGL